MSLTAPQPLQAGHDLSAFDSGRPLLDDWLRQRAARNEAAGASRTYVVCDDAVEAGKTAGEDDLIEPGRVVAYYCLSTGSVEAAQAPGKVRRNMPDPIPIMLLGRLAVDRAWQGRGLGRALLKDAVLRTLKAAEIAGLRALLVHGLDDEATAFYRHSGFVASPMDPLVLMLPLDSARRALG